MSKNRPNQPPSFEREVGGPPPRRSSGRPASLPAVARLVLSMLLAWHLSAVFLAPLSIPPSSEFVVSIAQRPPMQWYLDALYLNHGYHFFAPEPSTGHLIRYEVLDERGTVIKQGEFPDREDRVPRLRYHRHFMLADQAELPLPDEKVRDEWQRVYLTAYARHLLRRYDGQSVRVRRVAHYPAYRQDVLQGMELTDSRTYETLAEVVQRRADLEPDAATQSRALPNSRTDVARGWQGGAR